MLTKQVKTKQRRTGSKEAQLTSCVEQMLDITRPSLRIFSIKALIATIDRMGALSKGKTIKVLVHLAVDTQ